MADDFRVKPGDESSEALKKALVPISLVVVLSIGLVFLAPSEDDEEKKVELTKYQENYVDCPPKYLELCTKMSKIPTEEVSFIRAEEGKLHLRLEDGRKMVAKIEDGGSDGYLIRISE